MPEGWDGCKAILLKTWMRVCEGTKENRRRRKEGRRREAEGKRKMEEGRIKEGTNIFQITPSPQVDARDPEKKISAT
jgi:hypothetical protein